MAEIEMQDFSGEVQSPAIAGIVEALSRISGSMDMKTERLEKVRLSPVPGLDSSDPRRIYQAPGGSRLWLSYPEPIVYLNNAPVFSGDLQYSIDYIGGSITFNGDYKPSDTDQLSVSCVHISEGSYNSGGCELKILFSAGFAGMPFTVTSSAGESYSGVVPSSLVAYVSVKNTNTEYTISAADTSGSPHVTSVTTGQYYGQYEVSLDVFTATILVKAVKGATITAKDSAQATYTKIAGQDGNAAIYVSSADNYTITSEYNGVNSDTQIVNVSEDGASYNVTLNFITLLVTVESGSSVQVKNGLTTLSGTSDGTAKFYLPNTGTWTVTASKGDKSAETSVEASAYQQYSVELTYEASADPVLGNNTWEVISEISSEGKAGDYWEIGDTKTIVLNGTIGNLSLNNLNVDAYIIGINHNASKEGSNLIHFKIGKIEGKQIALCDSQYGEEVVSPGFAMNMSDINTGGWQQSYMRNTILGNGGTPSTPTSNSFMASLPFELRIVMKSAQKYTYNSSGVTATNDYLSLLSEIEIQGAITYAHSEERGHQTQYDYYNSGNSKSHYNYNSVSSSVSAWCRSPQTGLEYTFCCIKPDGSAFYFWASNSYGCSPLFFV